jgi:hypothetical protein
VTPSKIITRHSLCVYRKTNAERAGRAKKKGQTFTKHHTSLLRMKTHTNYTTSFPSRWQVGMDIADVFKTKFLFSSKTTDGDGVSSVVETAAYK